MDALLTDLTIESRLDDAGTYKRLLGTSQRQILSLSAAAVIKDLWVSDV